MSHNMNSFSSVNKWKKSVLVIFVWASAMISWIKIIHHFHLLTSFFVKHMIIFYLETWNYSLKTLSCFIYENCIAQSAENWETFKNTSVAHFPLFPIHNFPGFTKSKYSALTRDFLCDFLCLKYCDSALNILIQN